MRSRRLWLPLVCILGLYLGTGITYSLVTPVFEAPDESHHVFYVKHLIDQRALPVQRADSRGMWHQEGSQPPLYYLLGALLVGRADLSDAQELTWRNPQANIGDPSNPGNKNVYIHPASQDYPWQGTALAVHVLRFLSLAMGGGAVVVIWGTVRLLFPRSCVLPPAVAAVAAFTPQFLFISASVSNDNAMTLLGAASVFVMLLLLRDAADEQGGARGRRGGWWVLGILLSLALVSKLSALVLLALASVVIALSAWYRRSWQFAWRAGVSVALPVVLISGWWYARNLVLYGEPTGLMAMWEVVGRRDDFGEDLAGEFRALRYSFWGLFGWFSVAMPTWVYTVLDVLSVLALGGLALKAARWVLSGSRRAAHCAFLNREPRWGAAYRPLAYTVLGLWLLALGVLLVRWTSLTPGTQGRLLFPALGGFALFFVLGLRAWFPDRARDTATVIVAASVLMLGAAAPWLWIAPSFRRPAELASLPDDAIALDIGFGPSVVLRGVGFTQDAVHAGGSLSVDLFWETSEAISGEDELMVALRLVDPLGSFVGVEDAFPGAGSLPASLWPVGSIVAGRQYVRVGSDVPAPLVARVVIDLYKQRSGQPIQRTGSSEPIIGRIRVVPRRIPRDPRGQALARLEWREDQHSRGPTGVRLAAGGLPERVAPGEAIAVDLTWTALSSPDRDYTVFIHLEDDKGSVYGYGDGAPRGGLYPTWAWVAGDVVDDTRELLADESTPPGRYYVRAGLYDGSGRLRAHTMDGARWPGDAVDLGTVEVR